MAETLVLKSCGTVIRLVCNDDDYDNNNNNYNNNNNN
jgi:hypothetical protein